MQAAVSVTLLCLFVASAADAFCEPGEVIPAHENYCCVQASQFNIEYYGNYGHIVGAYKDHSGDQTCTFSYGGGEYNYEYTCIKSYIFCPGEEVFEATTTTTTTSTTTTTTTTTPTTTTTTTEEPTTTETETTTTEFQCVCPACYNADQCCAGYTAGDYIASRHKCKVNGKKYRCGAIVTGYGTVKCIDQE